MYNKYDYKILCTITNLNRKTYNLNISRSNRPDVFAKELFIKLEAESLRQQFYYKETPTQVFSEFFLRTFRKNNLFAELLVLHFTNSVGFEKLFLSILYRRCYNVTMHTSFTNVFMTSLIRRLSSDVVMTQGLVVRREDLITTF